VAGLMSKEQIRIFVAPDKAMTCVTVDVTENVDVLGQVIDRSHEVPLKSQG